MNAMSDALSVSTDLERISQTLGMQLFQRDWLSSNNVLFVDDAGGTALVDSGYHSHAAQTCALVEHGLAGRPLDLLVNTHLHSDHCGGNAQLQRRHPGVCTLIPPGQADAVRRWDLQALTYGPTGQECEPFRFDGLAQPGTELLLGRRRWQVHGAKGHDPHSIVLFEPMSRVLISADALWENGFGVVFPELEGISAFDEVAETLDLIETLEPCLVIPGHGRAFNDIGGALERARRRLAGFRADPTRHLRHAQKVLLKFRLLAWQRISLDELVSWARQTPYLASQAPGQEAHTEAFRAWVIDLLKELEQAGALKFDGQQVLDH